MNIFIVGLVLMAIALIFLVKYYALRADIRAIRATETSNIADLRQMQGKIERQKGVGTWREQVEVKGVVRSSRPLTAELSELLCVYYHARIEEKYERTEYETDEEGDTRVSDHRGTKVLSNHKNKQNFYLEDPTDKIFIDLNEAEIDGMTVVNEFKYCYRERSADYRILGYQRTEKIIELGSEIYIIGEVKNTNGRLQIGASDDRRKPFVISFRSEEELLRVKMETGKRQLYWGVGLGILGSIAIAYGSLAMLV